MKAQKGRTNPCARLIGTILCLYFVWLGLSVINFTTGITPFSDVVFLYSNIYIESIGEVNTERNVLGCWKCP